MAARRQTPGGNSSICLGSDPATDSANSTGAGPKAVPAGTRNSESNSSNAFANMNNPNAGNVLTERLSTRVRQAPGGTSSICFGTDTAAERFPPKQPEVANLPPPRAAERFTCAPGGASTICVGTDTKTEERFPSKKSELAGLPPPSAPERFKCAPGGTSTVCFGTETEAERFPRKILPRPGGHFFKKSEVVPPCREGTAAEKDAPAAGIGRATPGGYSSIQFGEKNQETTTAAKPDQKEEETPEEEGLQASSLGCSEVARPDENEEEELEEGLQALSLAPSEVAKENAAPNVPAQPMGKQPLKPVQAEIPEPTKLVAQYQERTTTRAPPGGRSSVMFG